MKRNQFFRRFKSQLKQITLMVFAVFTFASCDKDDSVGPTGPDTRLEGRDKVFILHDNPNTKAPYTVDELAALGYDPAVQDSFPSSYKAEIFIWAQQKPLRIEITKDGMDEAPILIASFARDNRPDLSDYKEGYGYSAKWKFKTGETDIPLGGSQVYNIKVVYHDQGIDGFTTNSVRETKFTVFHIEDKTVGTLADFLVGYWRFDDPSNLLKATVGNDLVLNGAASHSATAGIAAGDGAAHLDVGTWYDVLDHGVSDSFTMVWDVMVASADLGKYICLLQNLAANDSDGSLYIHPDAGFWLNGGGTPGENIIQADTWHRISTSYDGGDVLVYVDGVEVIATTVNWPIDPAKFIILGENSSNNGNGEDNPISISEFMVFNTAFSAEELTALPALGTPAVETIASSLKGRWKFDDAANLLKAECGNNLVLNGAASHSAEAGNPAITGDGAAHLDVGTWYDVVNHGVGAGEFSMIWDVKVNDGDLGTYICLLQENPANDSDGSIYIHPDAGFWLKGSGTPGDGIFIADQWHRVVVSFNAAGDSFVYVDGQEIWVGATTVWALDPAKFIILGENSSNAGNGEDNPISISDFMVFDKAFTADQIEAIPLIDKPAL